MLQFTLNSSDMSWNRWHIKEGKFVVFENSNSKVYLKYGDGSVDNLLRLAFDKKYDQKEVSILSTSI